MKIGIVGGTGDIGEGMALRLSSIFEVIIGSRDVDKALSSTQCCQDILQERGLPCCCSGVSNQEAVDDGPTDQFGDHGWPPWKVSDWP